MEHRGDKLSRRIVTFSAAPLLLVANGSCSDTGTADDVARTKEAMIVKAEPCAMQVDGSAIVTSFSVATSLTGSQFDLVRSLTSSYDSRLDTSSGLKVDDVQMRFFGVPFFSTHVEANTKQTQPVTKIVLDVGLPIIGPHHVEVNVSGTTAVATFDGRPTKPFAIDAPANSLRMQDGFPVPRFFVPPDWTARILRLSSLSQAEAASCPALGSTPLLAANDAQSTIQGHNSGPTFEHASGECLLLQGACVTAEASCVYAAYGAAAACAAIPVIGFFAAPVCAGASLYGCYEAEKACLSAAVTSNKCCPKRCGGSDDTPFCCFGDESCTDSGLLCCSPGNPPCGGNDCCINGDQCVKTTTCVGPACFSTAQCCPNDRACGTKCCQDGDKCLNATTGQCCQAGRECGSNCCEDTFFCGDASKSLCCGLGGEVCGNVCCGFFEDCVNGACIPTPPTATDCGTNSITCTTDADCPRDCGASTCKCQVLQNATTGCCVRTPT